MLCKVYKIIKLTFVGGVVADALDGARDRVLDVLVPPLLSRFRSCRRFRLFRRKGLADGL